MKVALCQFNPRVGDCRGNAERIMEMVRSYSQSGAELFVFPELCIQGYPPKDLLTTRILEQTTHHALELLCDFSKTIPTCGLCIGTATYHTCKPGRGLYNSAVLIENGSILFTQNKTLLPTYDVFDETRYFDPAPARRCFVFHGEHLGITICEDAWNSADTSDPLYAHNPVAELCAQGATILVNLSASPFHMGKQRARSHLMAMHAKTNAVPFIFVNQVGGNDDLIFDGASLCISSNGSIISAAPSFKEAVIVTNTTSHTTQSLESLPFDSIEQVHDALCLGITDYVTKCGFTKGLIGLSGGIDSAVVCALAVQALGPQNVVGITMPSRYSSEGSVNDSLILAKNLHIAIETIPIEPLHTSFTETMLPLFAGTPSNLAEENVQARLRGTILMAYSNKFGHLLLTTGNKSEMAVGYCTLYGDMNGGLAVIADLPKTRVYELAHYINRSKEIIPLATIQKPPSAELRPDQKDQDTLPPYETLDAILELLIEDGLTSTEIIKQGFDATTVNFITTAIRISEYKRRQAAPGLKVTSKAFGIGRRFPIASQYEL